MCLSAPDWIGIVNNSVTDSSNRLCWSKKNVTNWAKWTVCRGKRDWRCEIKNKKKIGWNPLCCWPSVVTCEHARRTNRTLSYMYVYIFTCIQKCFVYIYMYVRCTCIYDIDPTLSLSLSLSVFLSPSQYIYIYNMYIHIYIRLCRYIDMIISAVPFRGHQAAGNNPFLKKPLIV